MAEPKGEELRCWRCGKLLAKLVSAPYLIECRRCRAVNSETSTDRQIVLDRQN